MRLIITLSTLVMME